MAVGTGRRGSGRAGWFFKDVSVRALPDRCGCRGITRDSLRAVGGHAGKIYCIQTETSCWNISEISKEPAGFFGDFSDLYLKDESCMIQSEI